MLTIIGQVEICRKMERMPRQTIRSLKLMAANKSGEVDIIWSEFGAGYY
jgi:hypothetical protein